RFDGQICQVQLWIYGDLGPRSRVACVFGGTVKPCLNAILAWHGDSVENPQSFTRTNVKATNIAFDVADTAWIAASTVSGANNNHVVCNDGRGVKTNLSGNGIYRLVGILFEVHYAIVSEPGVRSTGAGIQGYHLITWCDIENATLVAVAPVRQPSARQLSGRRLTSLSFVEAIDPKMFTCCSIQCYDRAPGAGG